MIMCNKKNIQLSYMIDIDTYAIRLPTGLPIKIIQVNKIQTLHNEDAPYSVKHNTSPQACACQ